MIAAYKSVTTAGENTSLQILQNSKYNEDLIRPFLVSSVSGFSSESVRIDWPNYIEMICLKLEQKVVVMEEWLLFQGSF